LDYLTGIYTAPKSGRGDFVEKLVEELAKNENRAVDACGNDLSLEPKEKRSRLRTIVIAQISKRSITSFKEVLQVSPILAFHNKKKVRRFIEIINNEHKRKVNFSGFFPIREG